MTIETVASAAVPGRSILARLFAGTAGPLTLICLVIVAVWYGAAVRMNAPFLLDQYQRQGETWTFGRLVRDAWAQERPVLPAPHQIVLEIKNTTVDKKITSKRSLVFHAWVTLSSTLLGFLMGTVLGIALAVGIVHVRTLDLSLLPWIIASQTIPILAIAPMIIVTLGNIGFTGLVPKAIISTYLCFFPVAIGMVKGLRSPDPLPPASRSPSPSAWWAPSWASCRPAPRRGSARAYWSAPTTARPFRSGPPSSWPLPWPACWWPWSG
jgi:NitT/TauT family transport system permease protein